MPVPACPSAFSHPRAPGRGRPCAGRGAGCRGTGCGLAAGASGADASRDTAPARWSRPARHARLGLAALAALALLGGCTRPAEPEARTLALGRQVYDAHCAACHGAKLEGQPDWRIRRDDGRLPAPPHDASGHTWHHSDRVLFEITKHGVQRFAGNDYASDMPAFGGRLTDDEIRSVIAYIKSTWPQKVQRQQAELK